MEICKEIQCTIEEFSALCLENSQVFYRLSQSNYPADATWKNSPGLTIALKNATLEQMRVIPTILFSMLLVACDNKKEDTATPPTTTQQVPSVPETKASLTYTDAEKAELARNATGIEKLLRSNPIEYDCYQNEAAWSDDEFFRRYEEALTCDMEHFLQETFDDEHVIKTLGSEQVADDSSTARKSITALVNAAKGAYAAALAWRAEDAALGVYPNNELMARFRLQLRQRLLKDLFILGGQSMCYWSSGISENPDLDSVIDNKIPHFEACILDRAHTGGTMGYQKYNTLVIGRLEEQVKSYRSFIIDSCYYNRIHTLIGHDHDTVSPAIDKVVKLFQTSEAAWETYLNAISIAHAPIYNSFVGGSGTIGFNTRFQIDMLLSQMQYLGHAVKFANGGTPEYPAPIDFTSSEDTPQAAEERNNRPG